LSDAVFPVVEFGLLWSNPPIRVGEDQPHALLRQWPVRLSPDAHVDLVVRKNLGVDWLIRWLVGRPAGLGCRQTG
jgi:hypothetical protein